MPIYEYRCQQCGDFEVTQRITDKPLRRCPTCKGGVKKLISNTSFQLKGTGWYLTDYGRKDGASKEKPHKTETKGDGKTSSASTGSEKSSSDKSTTKPTTSESTSP